MRKIPTVDDKLIRYAKAGDTWPIKYGQNIPIYVTIQYECKMARNQAEVFFVLDGSEKWNTPASHKCVYETMILLN